VQQTQGVVTMNALELIVISLFIFLSPVLLYATARDL
jgi:hypothetical protein